jgi:hypothetical protein
MQHVYKSADMLTFFGFLIRKVERYSYYFIFNELLFEFLSFDEFKFVKSVGKAVIRPQS